MQKNRFFSWADYQVEMWWRGLGGWSLAAEGLTEPALSLRHLKPGTYVFLVRARSAVYYFDILNGQAINSMQLGDESLETSREVPHSMGTIELNAEKTKKKMLVL